MALNEKETTAELNAVIQDCKDIIKENCRLLKIDKPPTLDIVEAEDLPSPTTRFAVSENGTSIALNKEYIEMLLSTDQTQAKWLYLSHECRHVWQIQNGKYDKDEYKSSNQTTDLAEYNSQELELDAWAWSVFLVKLKTKFTPIFNGVFPPDIIAKITILANEIEKEYKK